MNQKLINKQAGFSVVEVLVVAVILAGLSFVGYKVYTRNASAAVATVTTQSNLSYGPDVAHKLDLYNPSTSGTALRPALIVIHGGGWGSGDKTKMSTHASYYSSQLSAVTININYRLGAAGTYPKAVDDVKLSLAWLKANAATYNIDPNRIGALGGSAGAHLAGMLSDQGVKTFVGWSGVYDFPAAATTDTAVSRFMGCAYSACTDAWIAASPTSHASPNVSMQLVNSTSELVPLAQMNALKAAQQAAGGYVETHEIPGTVHGAVISKSKIQDGRTVQVATRDFMKARL